MTTPNKKGHMENQETKDGLEPYLQATVEFAKHQNAFQGNWRRFNDERNNDNENM